MIPKTFKFTDKEGFYRKIISYLEGKGAKQIGEYFSRPVYYIQNSQGIEAIVSIELPIYDFEMRIDIVSREKFLEDLFRQFPFLKK